MNRPTIGFSNFIKYNIGDSVISFDIIFDVRNTHLYLMLQTNTLILNISYSLTKVCSRIFDDES